MAALLWVVPQPRYRSQRFSFVASEYGITAHSTVSSPFSAPNSRPPSPTYKRFLCASRYRCGICGTCFHQTESRAYSDHVKEHATIRNEHHHGQNEDPM